MTPMNRESLIEYLVTHPPRPAIRRALAEGQPVEFLGGFSKIPPSNMPGWIIRVTTRFGRHFYVALRMHKLCKLKLFIETIEKAPWEYWDGDKCNSLTYQGDNPRLYRRLKPLASRQENVK